MSAFVSFYLINNDKRDDLVRAAEAQSEALKHGQLQNKRLFGIFRRRIPTVPDPFWEFIRKNTQELEQFDYSGYLLLDIGSLAPSALVSEDDLGKRLSHIRQVSCITFQPEDAARAIKSIDQADFSDEAIEKLLVEEEREEESVETLPLIHELVNLVKCWLESVSEGNTGILIIG